MSSTLIQSEEPFRVYIASSFRNLEYVAKLTALLREDGYFVLDWTAKAPPIPDGLTLQQRKELQDSDERGDIYDFCASSCGVSLGEEYADIVVYLGPAGQDAACEVGMAYANDIPTVGLAGAQEKPGLILNRAVNYWCQDENELRAVLKQHAQLLFS